MERSRELHPVTPRGGSGTPPRASTGPEGTLARRARTLPSPARTFPLPRPAEPRGRSARQSPAAAGPPPLSDPVRRPTPRPPGEAGRARASGAALSPRHGRPAPPTHAKLADPRQGSGSGRPAPTPPDTGRATAPAHSPPGALLNLRRPAGRGSRTSEEGAGRGGRSRSGVQAPELNPETDCGSPGPAATARANKSAEAGKPQSPGGKRPWRRPEAGRERSPSDSGDVQEPRLCAALLCTLGPGRRAGPSAPARRSNSTRPTRHLRAPPPHPRPLARAPPAAGRGVPSARHAPAAHECLLSSPGERKIPPPEET